MAKKSNKTEHVLKLITKDVGQDTEESPQDKVEEESQKLFPEGESSFITENEHLVNLAEILVKDMLPEVMKKMNICTCDICTNDVMALALNNLPTKYVTTDMGKQYMKLDIYKKQYEIDVMAALTKACVRVKASPRH